ncbi:ferredoxin reductase [Kibdelosporangium persicum]|uniref:Oxidoreductase FAD-binding subunit n=2 Tax=Kibdelosporangium persicum TaxID=2698649 RepID=A0ABX2F366_9PSEU|nr:Oxidoreductase FAD-binding subunit [Kibdelosporangium persicum]
MVLRWLPGKVADIRVETPTSRTIVFDVPDWAGHLAGQHIDVRLTAEDGYSVQRSYSLAAPADEDRIEILVQKVTDGEVSPFLVDDLLPDDVIELRGPIGGWFTWEPSLGKPVSLVAGGSGIVPLMAMIRARTQAGSDAGFKLLYSVRGPADEYYAEELGKHGIEVTTIYTRSESPSGRPPGRIRPEDLSVLWPADAGARTYVCGPTGFVEAAAQALVDQGHDPGTIRTERFGPSGG